MLKNRGMTLVETLLAFSIFITMITVIFSGYTIALRHYEGDNKSYLEYIEKQNDKEFYLWQASDLNASINEVLH